MSRLSGLSFGLFNQDQNQSEELILLDGDISEEFSLLSPGAPFGPNLIKNPSLETAGLLSGLPEFWSHGSWDKNNPVPSYPVSGFDEERAVRIDIDKYVGGDSKWYFEDVEIAAGKHYLFSDSFKSTIPSVLTARFLLADNTYRYFDVANLPASFIWQTASQMITAPYNAKSLTIFHSIRGNGSLTTDNFSLREIPVSGGFSQGFVSLDFDDGWALTYKNALPILNKAGLKSTQSIISGSIKDWHYVNKSQILDMQNSGHEIASHTKTHADLTRFSASRVKDEVAGSKKALLSLGVEAINSFVYAHGKYNNQAEEAVKDAGFINARTIDIGYNTKTSNPYLLKSQVIALNTSFDEVKFWIDRAIADKTWVILVFHQIDYSGQTYSATPEMLQQIVDYLVLQNVSVLTNSQGAALLE